ncbi:amino acid transporter [Mycobacterium sp. URHB0021]
MPTTELGATQGGLKLRRSLNVWEAIGLSVAVMAPAMAANINPQGTASVVGRAVPLSFALATVGALLIAYSFIRLSQRFQHAGSVYGFVGAILGSRAGIFSGWILAVAYVLFDVYTAIAAGRFITDEMTTSGLWPGIPDYMGFVFAGIALLVVLYFATRTIQGGTRLLLVVEGLTVMLIVVVTGVVLGKLLTHAAPGGQTFDPTVFTPAPGTGLSSVFLGVVFGFLSFGGFEAAATLGEETIHPRRDVPRAVIGTVLFGGVFFVVVTAVEVMGFGTSQDGIAAFVASPSLLGDLGTSYVGSWIGHLITIGAAVSAISCATACAVSASRLVYAFSRDGAGAAPLNALSQTHQVPARAVWAVLTAAVSFGVLGWIISRGAPFSVSVVVGTAATLMLLVVYLMATASTIKLLFFSGSRAVSKWEIIIPAAGLLVLGYTIWRNLYPFPVGSAWWGPGLFIAALAGVLVTVVIRADVAKNVSAKLIENDGLEDGSVITS